MENFGLKPVLVQLQNKLRTRNKLKKKTKTNKKKLGKKIKVETDSNQYKLEVRSMENLQEKPKTGNEKSVFGKAKVNKKFLEKY